MKYGLIAERVNHSFSAEIHKKLFGYEYELKSIAKEELDSFMKEKNFSAINVTIPYKQQVIPYMDIVDETAKQIGAVNTIVNKNGKLYGYNTDLSGIIALITKNNIVISNKKVLVLGSGGTSKTAAFAANQLEAGEVFRVSRTAKDGCISYEEAKKKHSDAEIIINTTPVGMYPEIGTSPIDLTPFNNLSAVVDVVYNPLKTKLVCDAEKKGIKAVGGLFMLVAQAAFAAEKFVDSAVPSQKISEIYNEIFLSKQNVILIGMPGSGKTATGKHIANKLNRKFIDSDDVITQKTGLTPCEIITQKGESAFRDIESLVIKEISALQGVVISTGGGAVLRKENTDILKENGRIYFIDRPLEKIRVSEDRPLSSNVESLKKRFEERYAIYCNSCDVRFSPVDGAELNANIVLEDFYENSCN